VARVAALLALAVAAIFSIRLAVADHLFRRRTPESVARALALLPGNTSYLALRALELDYDDQPADALLERTARLNPLASEPRIRLGLGAETRGDFAAAEKWLLDAARVDHQYEPRWTLANFYFRQERENDFWKWLRQALAVSYGDRRLAFDLAWRVSQDQAEILARAIPPDRDVMRAYLDYVIDQHRDAAGSAALPLAALHDPADLPALEAACDVLIEAGKTAEAQALWSALGHASEALLTNGGFAEEPRGHGFDWRPLESMGVQHANLAAPAGHRISFSGKQAEACDLLLEYVVLARGRRYRLHWDARTVNLASPSGIEWVVGNTTGVVESADAWRAGSAVFTAPAGLLPVKLRFRRPAGQPRAEGAVEIRNVSLTEEAQ
jgi:tetratricopeptide (TPR) repeat protein